MPQFDFYSFSGQSFWILVAFFIFYFFIMYFYLTHFSEMFKMRQKLINFYSAESNLQNSAYNFFDFFYLRIFKA